MHARQVSCTKTPLVEIFKQKAAPLEMRSPNHLLHSSQPLKLGKHQIKMHKLVTDSGKGVLKENVCSGTMKQLKF